MGRVDQRTALGQLAGTLVAERAHAEALRGCDGPMAERGVHSGGGGGGGGVERWLLLLLFVAMYGCLWLVLIEAGFGDFERQLWSFPPHWFSSGAISGSSG